MTERFPPIEAQHWLANRLGFPHLFHGMTDNPIRRERIREAIIELGWAGKRAGYYRDEPETFAELFERLWGVPLFTTGDEDAATQQEALPLG